MGSSCSRVAFFNPFGRCAELRTLLHFLSQRPSREGILGVVEKHLVPENLSPALRYSRQRRTMLLLLIIWHNQSIQNLKLCR